MTQEAYAYDTSNVGVQSRTISPEGETRDYVNVGIEARIIVPEGITSDWANVGIEDIPIIYYNRPQAGWGVTLIPSGPLGQISGFSEGDTYDYADVTT